MDAAANMDGRADDDESRRPSVKDVERLIGEAGELST